VTFAGQFKGSREDFERAILPYAGKYAQRKTVQLISLSQHGRTWNLNGALMYRDTAQLRRRVDMLLSAGIESVTLQHLVDKV
jgi:hypothetical protein